MTVVLDASLTLAWCFEDETTPRTEALLDRVREEGAVVSSIWRLEVANGLLSAQKRRRMTSEKSASMAGVLDALPVEDDAHALSLTISWALGLAVQYSLTPYDSTYVELAFRRGLPLACNDDAMQMAALALGVEVL